MIAAALLFAPLPSCTKKAEGPLTAEQIAEKRVARGRSTYMAQCLSCHNADPKRDGSLGPAIAGSSRELLESRILRAEYPTGYTPKRTSKTMPAMPHLKNELDALHAFLNLP